MKSLIHVEDVPRLPPIDPMNEGITAPANSKAIELDTGRKIPAPRSEGWSSDEVTDSC